jgi:hypothetical protein
MVVALQFDEFARRAVGKTVAEVADYLQQSNMLAAGQFAVAAARIGFMPQAQLTPEVLSNPVFAVPLARAAGIGTGLSDEQWRQAHNRIPGLESAPGGKCRHCRATGAARVAPLRASNPKTV